MSAEVHLAELVEVCRARLAARDADSAAMREVRRLLWLLAHEDRVRRRDIPGLARAALLEAGVPPEDVRRLGLSWSSVRLAVERDEP